MKKSVMFMPLISYLLCGLLLALMCGLAIDTALFVVWGVMAGVILEIQAFFSNKAVTVGITIYAVCIVGWFLFFAKENGTVHALLIVVSFAALLALRWLFTKRVVNMVAGYGVMIVMFFGSVFEIDFSKILVAFAIVLFLNAVSETIACFYGGNVRSLIVIYVIVSAVVFVMPTSKEPYGWDFVFRIIAAVEDTVTGIINEINYQLMDVSVDGVFHYSSTGYSDNPMNLASGLVEQDVEQLVLEGNRTKRNMYIKGNVSNKYLGNSWSTDFSEMVIDYRVDALMTLYAIFGETEDLGELHKFMEIKKQKVSLQNIKTKSLFYPVKILDISVENIEKEGDYVRSQEVKGRGYSYSYCFLDIDYSSEVVKKLLCDDGDVVYEKEAYDRIYTNLYEFYGVEIEKLPFEEFVEMAENSEKLAQKYCMDVGDEVSDNVKSLAQKVAFEAGNDYERCKMLEKYLYRYTYNKAISVPDNTNVLDWFLFEGKEGYCAHYATSLAVMLRSEGVPARIAEGFLVDYKDVIDSQSYSISSKTAHVWVEAYMDGFGWIRLEPTVVNAGNANAVWFAQNVTEEVDIPEEDLTEQIKLEQEQKEKQKMSWMLMLKMLGGMAFVVVVILIGLLIYRRIAIRKSENPDVVFSHMIDVLGKRYVEKIEAETFAEYIVKLSGCENVEEELINQLRVIQKVMETYWYGGGTVTTECIANMKNIAK